MSRPVTLKTTDSFTAFSDGPLEVGFCVLGGGVFGVLLVTFDPEGVACEVTDDVWYVLEKLAADEVEDVVVGEEADDVTNEGWIGEANGAGDEVEAAEVANGVGNEGTIDKAVVVETIPPQNPQVLAQCTDV